MSLPEITDFQIGQTVSFTHEITQIDIDRFVELTGDDNPMHVDSEFAEKTSIKSPVAHGMLTASFISTVIGKHLPGPGSLWVSQKLEFISPVRAGDQITIHAEIKKINAAQRLITIAIEIKNQLNRPVIRSEAIVRWPEHKEKNNLEIHNQKNTKVALVTGASRGIGAEIAIQLGKLGYFVYLNYNQSESKAAIILEQIKQNGGNGSLIRGDIFNEKSIAQIFSEIKLKHNYLDLLVNNASPKIEEEDFYELNWDKFESQFIPHLKSLFCCIQQSIPLFEKNQGGCVVNIGSVVAEHEPPTQWLGYNLGKGTIHLMTKNLAKSLGLKKIRINTVAPGMTETDLTADIPERQKLLLKMNTPLGRLALPSDIAAAVVFLASDNAAHITGQTLHVNGGIY